MVNSAGNIKLPTATKLGVWTASFLTACVGIINLISAATPSLHNRVAWLRDIFPFDVRANAHLSAALSGFFLLTLATNLLRRKRVAWWFTVCLLVVSTLSHLVKGWDYEEALLSLILLLQLFLLRSVFTARSDRPSLIQGTRVLLGALLFTLAYGTFGFWLQERHFSTEFSFLEAIVQTLAMFFTSDNWGLEPTTRFGRYFADSIYGVGAVTLLYAIWMLFRPVVFRGTATPSERRQAQNLIEKYGRSSLAHFALLDDKSYYFSPSGQTVIAYVPKGRGAIALGDPIGPPSDVQEAILGFQEFCLRNDWHPAFYQTLPESLAHYQALGFHTLKIGEEAIVNLHQFTLDGKVGRNLRTPFNKFTKQGYRVKYYAPPLHDEDLLAELRAISDAWLAAVEGSEKKFSLGWFNLEYLQACEIAVVEDSEGYAVAFANIVPEYQLNEVTIDLMRHRPDVEAGAMDFLFISLLKTFKERGYDTFNLGLVVLAGVGESPESSRIEKGMRYLYKHLNQFYNVKGLRAYKEKFHPYWEPRYFVYPRLADLPEVVVSLVRADSGDRLQDYFGAQFFSTALTTLLQRFSHYGPVLISVSLFILSIWGLTKEFHKYPPETIFNSVTAIPIQNLVLALFLTLLNYFFLTGYDILATYFVNHPLPYPKIALVSIISYAISNSVGFALLSGSAIRYRFYTAWGLSPGKITQIIAFCNISFWIGLFAVGGGVFALEPLAVPDILRLPFETVRPIGFLFLMIIAAYLILSAMSRRSLKIKNWVLPHLPLGLSIAQIIITSCDWALAAAILFLLFPTHPDVNFFVFFGSYLLAQLAGLISNVPGGLGVFETVLILLLCPPVPSDQLLGALLVYRGIYYLFPLVSGLIMLLAYEVRKQHQHHTGTHS